MSPYPLRVLALPVRVFLPLVVVMFRLISRLPGRSDVVSVGVARACIVHPREPFLGRARNTLRSMPWVTSFRSWFVLHISAGRRMAASR